MSQIEHKKNTSWEHFSKMDYVKLVIYGQVIRAWLNGSEFEPVSGHWHVLSA